MKASTNVPPMVKIRPMIAQSSSLLGDDTIYPLNSNQQGREGERGRGGERR